MMNHDWPKPTIPWEGVIPFPLASIRLGDRDVTQSGQKKGNSDGEVLGNVILSDKMTLVRKILPLKAILGGHNAWKSSCHLTTKQKSYENFWEMESEPRHHRAIELTDPGTTLLWTSCFGR